MKCQSRQADNSSDNTVTSKPSGAYNVTSDDLKNANDVYTKEGFCLMDDLNLQGKSDKSLLPEGVDCQAMTAESRVVCIGQEDDISEQLKVYMRVCVVYAACVCACVCVRVCVCTCTYPYLLIINSLYSSKIAYQTVKEAIVMIQRNTGQLQSQYYIVKLYMS